MQRTNIVVASFVVALAAMSAGAQEAGNASPPGAGPTLAAPTGKVLNEAIALLNAKDFEGAQRKIATLARRRVEPLRAQQGRASSVQRRLLQRAPAASARASHGRHRRGRPRPSRDLAGALSSGAAASAGAALAGRRGGARAVVRDGRAPERGRLLLVGRGLLPERRLRTCAGAGATGRGARGSAAGVPDGPPARVALAAQGVRRTPRVCSSGSSCSCPTSALTGCSSRPSMARWRTTRAPSASCRSPTTPAC